VRECVCELVVILSAVNAMAVCNAAR